MNRDDVLRSEQIANEVLLYLFNDFKKHGTIPKDHPLDANDVSSTLSYSGNEIEEALSDLHLERCLERSKLQFGGALPCYWLTSKGIQRAKHLVLTPNIDKLLRTEPSGIRQTERLTILRYMYNVAVERSNNPENTSFAASEIAEQTRVAEPDVEAGLNHLVSRKFVEVFVSEIKTNLYELRDALENDDREQLPSAINIKLFQRYRISNLGILEVEKGILEAAKPSSQPFTQYLNQEFHQPVGSVQNGPYATAHVTQNIGAGLSSVLALLDQLKQDADELPEESRDEAQVTLESLETELQGKQEPRKMNVFLKRLGSLAQGTVAFASQVATLGGQLKDLGIL